MTAVEAARRVLAAGPLERPERAELVEIYRALYCHPGSAAWLDPSDDDSDADLWLDCLAAADIMPLGRPRWLVIMWLSPRGSPEVDVCVYADHRSEAVLAAERVAEHYGRRAGRGIQGYWRGLELDERDASLMRRIRLGDLRQRGAELWRWRA